MDDSGLTDVAAALCALPLGTFTAERKARAAAARADGDRDLAARIAALPKPSVAAWVVDRLVREAPGDLDRLLELGSALQQAQDDRDRDRLRDLTADRRTLLPEIARAAAERAEQDGQRVGDGVLEEVQQTLQAALASAEAAAAVATGRLVRALDADGLDPVDLRDAVAGGPATPRRAGGRAHPAPDRRQAEQEEQREQERRAQERRAQERIDAARRHADETATAARDADAVAEDRARDAADLAKRLAELQERVDAARRVQEEADAAAAAARTEAARSAEALERLAGER